MILVDTSVWICHLRLGNVRLTRELEAGQVLGHPFVLGELACGTLKQRIRILTLLAKLPQARMASHAEVQTLIDGHQLSRRGLGLIDMHLLASALIENAKLLTLDKRLANAFASIGS